MFSNGIKKIQKRFWIFGQAALFVFGIIPIAFSRGTGGHGGGYRTGSGYSNPDITLILWIAVIAGLVFIVGSLVKWMISKSQTDKRRESPLEILQRRYAAGEITKEEFNERKRDLDLGGGEDYSMNEESQKA